MTPRAELALRLEQARRRVELPIAYFRPHAKQQQVIEGLAQRRVCIMVGGNRSGKTMGAAHICLANAYGYRPWEVPGIKVLPSTGDLPPRDNVPRSAWVMRPNGRPMPVPNMGFAVTGLPRERGLGQIIAPEFEKTLPPRVKQHAAFRMPRGAQGVASLIDLPNGSRIVLASADQDPLTFEGTRIQWSWCDEPVAAYVYNGLIRGLLMDEGTFLFTLTPLGNDCAWLYGKFMAEGAESRSDATVVVACMRDNPYLSEQAIDDFIKNGEFSEAEKRARLFGEFESLGTRVLYNFRRAHHVVPAREIPPGVIIGQVVDPHHVRPAAVIWFWYDPNDHVYTVFREWPTAYWPAQTQGGKTPSEYAELFRNIEGRHPAKVRWADPRFAKAEFSVNGERKSCWADEMARCGMPFRVDVPNTAQVEPGEQKLVELLKWAESQPRSPFNCPKVVISEECRNVISACENYSLLPTRERSIQREKRAETWKDWIDVLRYMVLAPIPPDILFGGPVIQTFSEEDWKEHNSNVYW